MPDQQQAAGRDAVTAELAGRLWRAEADRVAIDPIRAAWPDLTVGDAYDIQTRNVQRRLAAGHVICGRKIGLTSRPMQEFLRVFEPTFGVLLDDMFVDDGDEIALAELIQPRVEAEIAFVMGRDLAGPGVTTSNALTAIGAVLPALEIGDSRIADWRIQLVDTVADNASSGRLVLGGKLTEVTDLDLSVVGMVISRNGELMHTGAGAAVTGQSGAMRGVAGQQARLVRRRPAGRRRGPVRSPAPADTGAARRCVPRGVRSSGRGHDSLQRRWLPRRPGPGGLVDPKSIADQLITAERERTAIPAFTSTFPFLGVKQAYLAQDLVVRQRLASGERLIGAKLGLTSRIMQQVINVHEPVYGWLTSGMVAPAGEPLPLDELIHPRAEPEIAFLLRAEPDRPATITSVLAATEAVFGAIEVFDSRYGSYSYRLPDVIADNVGAARFVLGSQARKPGELEDLRLVGCVFRSHGEVVGTGAGGAALGHPAAAVAWLVNVLAAGDKRLAAGSLVLSGGLTAPAPLRRGRELSADFDGLGTVSVYG